MVSIITWLGCALFLTLFRTDACATVGVSVPDRCSVSLCQLSDSMREELNAIKEKLGTVVDYEIKVQRLELDVQAHLQEARLGNAEWSPRNNGQEDITPPDWSSDTWRVPRTRDAQAVEERFLSLEYKLTQLSTTMYEKLNDYSSKIDQVETALKTMQKWMKTTDDMIRSVNDSALVAIQQMQIKLKETEKQIRQEIRENVASSISATSRQAEELSKRNVLKPTVAPIIPQTPRPLIPAPCMHHLTDKRLIARHNGHEMPNMEIPSGGIMIFECRHHFMEIRGSIKRQCWNGTWATSLPTCVVKPQDPNGGASITTRLQPGADSSGDTTCKPGYAGNVRHSSNCAGFFMCSPGHRPVWILCPIRTFFHVDENKCLSERPSDCPVT